MHPPKAYKALSVTLLGITLGCGDPGSHLDDNSEIAAAHGYVVGGWRATTSQIFATVEIRRPGASAGFCSGTLISAALVVTAAHCAVIEPDRGLVQPIAPGAFEVVAGHLDHQEVAPNMIRSVEYARVHEGYDHDFIMGRSRTGAGQGGMGSPNDIALLFLAEPFDHVPKAPMLRRERESELVHHGDLAFVAGYGVYDLDADLSGQLYISDAVIDILGQRELLTRRLDQLGDSCFGDSGGPLYVPTEEGDYLVGLVSRGRSDVKRDCGDGGVYTLLSAYLPWIEDVAGDEFEPAVPQTDESRSFLAAGADPIHVPKGGSLDGAVTCAASSRTPDDRSTALVEGVLLLLFSVRRRLSPV